MSWNLSRILWDGGFNLPSEAYVSWEQGINSREDAIDFIADIHNEVILSCRCIED